MKKKFRLMKEVTQTTQYSPKDRHEEITEFVGNNEFKGNWQNGIWKSKTKWLQRSTKIPLM